MRACVRVHASGREGQPLSNGSERRGEGMQKKRGGMGQGKAWGHDEKVEMRVRKHTGLCSHLPAGVLEALPARVHRAADEPSRGLANGARLALVDAVLADALRGAGKCGDRHTGTHTRTHTKAEK